ncbi:cupin domain-containing protein [Paeniglutamicibacter cryotolerans]|uniref:Oxalate decarboxylase/phosphoglucose isomerase-like protein (Cupin superfamily) n=1 Tax=Paeniglutamicibacter cryotolerans TaxID=670079 RepID=A0A839QQF8_9MICC|nr:cupin domain-containing protein [Paeniglutamicibacter cryotolerans]MBB2995492.1 oxalate decarboxylase/phosphoglucose isomerase-like protein (cupin superfamily) [Paeniglutamicibacter cryotolerans]
MLEKRGEHSFDHELHGGSRMRVASHFAGSMTLPVAVQTWELPPGGSEGLHAHGVGPDAVEEFYLVVSGTASMRLGELVHELEAGDCVLAVPGVEHDLRNTGAGTLRMLVIWGPPGNADLSGFGTVARALSLRSTETDPQNP